MIHSRKVTRADFHGPNTRGHEKSSEAKKSSKPNLKLLQSKEIQEKFNDTINAAIAKEGDTLLVDG